jgi:dTDP-4-amino-4,6-dideoxygalactose transaminase
MISRCAIDPARCTHRLAFTSSARVAWRLILELVEFPKGATLLLPAYVGTTDREGSGIIDPIDATHTPYTLYPLGDHLQVDLGLIEAMLRSGRYRVMLVVHYFGIVHTDLHGLRELCERYDTLLVEDCAHVVRPVGSKVGPGAVGHAAFYSLHKCIAVSTGGVLRLNDAPFDIPSPEGRDRCAPEVLEQLVRTDLRSVGELRRANYRWLVQRLAGVDGLTVLYPNLGTLVPHDFPVWIHDGLREKLYFALLDEGLPTIALYYRLVDTIRPEEFPLSHALSRSVLNLPVHQDTTITDLEHLTDRLTRRLALLRA